MHPALQLADILKCIIECIAYDTRTLFRASLVNRAWAAEACPHLWRFPTLAALAALPTERRQHIATFVRVLNVRSVDAETAATLFATTFPRLDTLSLHYRAPTGISFAGRCPQLSSLFAGSDLGDEGREDVCALLRTNAGTLKSVHSYHPVTTASLIQLAGLGRLADLYLVEPVEQGQLDDVVQRVPSPFAAIRSLTFRARAPAVFLMLQLLSKRATSLHLDFNNSVSVDLSALTAFTQLVSLRVAFPNALALRKEHLAPLRSLVQLEVFQFGAESSDTAHGPAAVDMTNDDVIHLVAGLRWLSSFYFLLRAPLTVAALTGIGARCRSLEYLRFLGSYALADLGSGVRNNIRLFPILCYLTVDGTHVHGGDDDDDDADGELDDADACDIAAKIVRIVEYHAPTLEALLVDKRPTECKVDKMVRSQWFVRHP